MHIKNITADVRIVTVGQDITVEAHQNGAWSAVYRTNELSNDYAASEAKVHAYAAVKRLWRDNQYAQKGWPAATA